MFNKVDELIDRVTMYRLVEYYLIALLSVAVIFSALGYLHYSPVSIVASALILVVVCWVTNRAFSAIFNAPTNPESSIITALILALIISPANDAPSFAFLLAAGGLAIASKYLLTIGKKHIFNPAAVAVVITALGPKQSASWWVGTELLLPLVLIGGFLVIRKIRRAQMVIVFLVSSFIATAVYSLLAKEPILSTLSKTALSSGIFFFAFVMLTEPSTSPNTPRKQSWYGLLAGLLFPPQAHIVNFYSSPEIALVISNAFSYIISPKTKLFLTLKEKIRIAPDSIDFIFHPNRKFSYKPGQYMEWTLDHAKTDSRGARRYFTLASSPTETDLRIGVKFYKNGSSFKEALLNLDRQTPIIATSLTGDFVLPTDHKRKLAFIAGGIGITPFRSMLQYLIDRSEQRSIIMLYSARNADVTSYKSVLKKARQNLNAKIVYYLTDADADITDEFSRAGRITREKIKLEIPDYKERLFYISGTHSMVKAMEKILQDLGVENRNIKTDFFPGYS